MLCVHNSIEHATIVSDIIVSSGCPSDVVVLARQGIEPDWVVYVPAGRGVEVHSASLPMTPGRSFSVGVAYKGDDPQPDMRCAVSTVWHTVDQVADGQSGTVKPNTPVATVIETLRAKVAAGTASADDMRVLQAMCHAVGDSGCEQQLKTLTRAKGQLPVVPESLSSPREGLVRLEGGRLRDWVVANSNRVEPTCTWTPDSQLLSQKCPQFVGMPDGS